MLYPREQKSDENEKFGRLIYDCRICGYFEKAKAGSEEDNCVYKSEIARMSEKFTVDPECIKDPALSRNKDVKCVNKDCDSREAVTFTNPTKERMNLIYVCVKCCKSWKKDELNEKEKAERLILEQEIEREKKEKS